MFSLLYTTEESRIRLYAFDHRTVDPALCMLTAMAIERAGNMHR